ncbi:hypothetical protein Tco_0601741, partial [Tanacetum coccineum]
GKSDSGSVQDKTEGKSDSGSVQDKTEGKSDSGSVYDKTEGKSDSGSVQDKTEGKSDSGSVQDKTEGKGKEKVTEKVETKFSKLAKERWAKKKQLEKQRLANQTSCPFRLWATWELSILGAASDDNERKNCEIISGSNNSLG